MKSIACRGEFLPETTQVSIDNSTSLSEGVQFRRQPPKSVGLLTQKRSALLYRNKFLSYVSYSIQPLPTVGSKFSCFVPSDREPLRLSAINRTNFLDPNKPEATLKRDPFLVSEYLLSKTVCPAL
ncbi:hypothetical protein RUM43_004194 [Polyplax serrata]|uniref:Uncharacterized protein n=1 Tax=Polyplax serrata TaxID=468196 RepID=A0AAN8SAN8_POLSC